MIYKYIFTNLKKKGKLVFNLFGFMNPANTNVENLDKTNQFLNPRKVVLNFIEIETLTQN